MKSKLDFAKAMLAQARVGASRAKDSDVRDYAMREERRWEKEIARLSQEGEQAGKLQHAA